MDAADFPGAWRELRAHWDAEIADRARYNAEHFEPMWDLTGPDYAAMVGHGTGLSATPSRPGEFAVERRGDLLLTGIYPGGAYTHLLSTKHPGVIQTPSFEIDSDYISFRVMGGDLSFVNLIIENYAVPRGGIYHLRHSPKSDEMGWVQWDTEFWKGFTAYIEFATQDDATRFQLDPRGQPVAAPADAARRRTVVHRRQPHRVPRREADAAGDGGSHPLAAGRAPGQPQWPPRRARVRQPVRAGPRPRGTRPRRRARSWRR